MAWTEREFRFLKELSGLLVVHDDISTGALALIAAARTGLFNSGAAWINERQAPGSDRAEIIRLAERDRAWMVLIEAIAQAVRCLPSKFPDANGHILDAVLRLVGRIKELERQLGPWEPRIVPLNESIQKDMERMGLAGGHATLQEGEADSLPEASDDSSRKPPSSGSAGESG